MKRLLKWLGSIVAALVAILVVLGLYVQFTWDKPDGRPSPQMTAPHDSATIARGEYIFKYAWQCWGCHATSGDGNAPPSGGSVFDLALREARAGPLIVR